MPAEELPSGKGLAHTKAFLQSKASNCSSSSQFQFSSSHTHTRPHTHTHTHQNSEFYFVLASFYIPEKKKFLNSLLFVEEWLEAAHRYQVTVSL